MTVEAEFLRAGDFIDCDHPEVVTFAAASTRGLGDKRTRALALYAAVRDDIKYEVYLNYTDPSVYRASGVLRARKGFCVGKAALLAACARAIGIPARVGYADVRNHMTSGRLYEMMQSDVFAWHSYAELKIEGVWVKATPAFDSELCGRIGIAPLEFDGMTDSLFQAIDAAGRRRLQYLAFRGSYADVPFGDILAEFRARYPGLFTSISSDTDFRDEALGHLRRT